MKLLFVLFLSLFSFSVFAGGSGQVSSGKTEFLAVGKPGFLKIKGVGPAPTGKFSVAGDMVSAELDIVLAEFKTGLDLRDSHMKEKYLEVQKYPTAKLKISDLKLSEAFESTKSGELKFKGTLSLHGVDKSVEGTIDYKKEGSKLKTESSFEFTIPDFGIDIPSFAGVTVAKEVKVRVEANFEVQ
jgi:polyisoprenoid-binding protein YceI